MTDMKVMRAAAAAARKTGTPQAPTRATMRFASELRAKKVERDGVEFMEVEGYASVVERSYEMWDFFGPYNEIVAADAFAKTLEAKPMVVYRFNHTGTPMATTRNGRLVLEADSTGLRDVAYLNPQRTDVQELLHAIRDEDVTEQSFMFRITGGQWSPDYSEYRITEVDLDRGDVGPVTYGASPHTSVAARSGEILAAIPHLPGLAARAALDLLAARADLGTTIPAPASAGRGLSLVRAMLDD